MSNAASLIRPPKGSTADRTANSMTVQAATCIAQLPGAAAARTGGRFSMRPSREGTSGDRAPDMVHCTREHTPITHHKFRFGRCAQANMIVCMNHDVPEHCICINELQLIERKNKRIARFCPLEG
jgi:hypothetical protein